MLWVAARCAANGRLVDVDDLVEMVETQYVFMGGRFIVRAVDAARCGCIQSFVDQGGFARSRYACDASEQTHRKGSTNTFQVVTGSPHNFNKVFARRMAFGGYFNGFSARQILTGQ